MAGIHITDIESAINYWREKSPSPDGFSLAAPTRALAEVYALMVFYHETEADEFSFPPAALITISPSSFGIGPSGPQLTGGDAALPHLGGGAACGSAAMGRGGDNMAHN